MNQVWANTISQSMEVEILSPGKRQKMHVAQREPHWLELGIKGGSHVGVVGVVGMDV